MTKQLDETTTAKLERLFDSLPESIKWRMGDFSPQYDPWGTIMCMLFPVCELLTIMGHQPDGFSPGGGWRRPRTDAERRAALIDMAGSLVDDDGRWVADAPDFELDGSDDVVACELAADFLRGATIDLADILAAEPILDAMNVLCQDTGLSY